MIIVDEEYMGAAMGGKGGIPPHEKGRCSSISSSDVKNSVCDKGVVLSVNRRSRRV